MYGLINNAVKAYVTKRYGAEKWQQACDLSKIEEDQFSNFSVYHDDVTYAIVGAICQLTDTSAEAMLTEIGFFWVEFALTEGYGPYFDAAGSSVSEFVKNLNNMHTRLETIFPGYKPPQFDHKIVDDSSILIDYRSHRAGLLPLALGIFEGLAKHFDESIQINVREVDEREGSYTFSITFE